MRRLLTDKSYFWTQMKVNAIQLFFLLLFLSLGVGCANIVPPTGGAKDVTPPKLVEADPADSLLNVRATKIVLNFDEYITVSDASSQVQISPLLTVPLKVVGAYKHVTVTIPDSLLQENTTYRISFGNAIKDLHENNVFSGYTYVFSTGSYFDSLKIAGKVINASTGLPDTSATILLYSASGNDSAIVRQKPLYVSKVGMDGTFKIDGLPAKSFRIYALRDKNGNLIYDGGATGEWIGFANDVVHPSADSVLKIDLQLFPEGKDTTSGQSILAKGARNSPTTKSADKKKDALHYVVAVDTADARKRTLEITKPVTVAFNVPPATILKEKIFLSYDSSGTTVEQPVSVSLDTATKENLLINTAWKENTLYTLRLIKGFIKDSSGADALPSRYTFRTKREDDYGKLDVHLPTKYWGKGFVLQVSTDKDTIYQKPVLDTMVHLQKLMPGTYIFRVIVDKNENGVWDSGDLFKKIQPETVIPYNNNILLKAGWQNIIDFDEQKKKK